MKVLGVFVLLLVMAFTIPGVFGDDGNGTQVEEKKEWTGIGYETVPVTDTYATMKFSPEEIREWYSTRYQTNPSAPEPSSVTEGTCGSKSLLSYLSYIPKERNQAYCGNCWVWGTTGAVEIGLSTQAQIKDRLSIQYVNSNYHNGGKYPYSGGEFACEGGWPESLADFYLYQGDFGGKKILVPWSNANASYADVKGSEIGHTVVDPATIQTTPNYPITGMTIQTVKTENVTWNQAVENIKYQIDNNRAVILCFYLPDKAAWDSFRRFWKYGDEEEYYFPMDQFASRPYDSKNGAGGHAVLVTGYEDYGDYGYLQCLNSWGAPDNRPNGIFYIDMYQDFSAKYPNDVPITIYEVVDLKAGQSPVPGSMDLTLLPGWNHISTPKTLRPGNDTFSIFKDVDSAGHSMYTCDPVSGWIKMQPDDVFEPLEGVWVYANATSTVSLYFDNNPIRTPPTRELVQGWSTIGFSSTSPVSANATLMSVSDQWSYLIPFDSTSQSYEETIIKGESGVHSPSYLMQPGSGYWLYMAGNGTLSAIST